MYHKVVSVGCWVTLFPRTKTGLNPSSIKSMEFPYKNETEHNISGVLNFLSEQDEGETGEPLSVQLPQGNISNEGRTLSS